MAKSGLDKVVEYLRRAVLIQDGAGQTDGKLLGCFLEEQDEAAFEALVHRHGPMVMDVGRRILRNQQDAEDAFQATFFVLFRKAATVAPREKVGNWLYGVANRTAIRVQALNARRRGLEKQVKFMPEPQAPTSECNDDLRQVLDQELSRLPEKYRIVIVLCDLEGRSRKDVARQLGWPEGSVSGRLARGRALLAKRLAKHGLLFSAEALGILISQNTASACLPPGLASATVKAAAIMATSQTAAISAKVLALTEGVLLSMFLTKVKMVTSVLVLAGVLCAGTVVSTRVFTAQSHGAAAVGQLERCARET